MKFVSQMPQNEVMPSRAQMKKASLSTCFFGGDGGDRTHDLLNAIQALSQLSYAPECIHTTTFIYVLQVLF